MIYLDHHSTTPLAPEALEAMLPLFQEHFANAGSLTHQAGREVARMVDDALDALSLLMGATRDEIVVTSGATESNNLAIFGICLHPRQKRRKVVSVVTEHKALLDPLARLRKHGFEVVLLPVNPHDSAAPGHVDLGQLAEAVDSDTALVSVMLANNEIGTIESLRPIADMCHACGALLHTDATQAIGKIPVDVDLLDVDLLSFSAHKFYGPKGVGGLFVRRRLRPVKLQAQIVGGGQQHNFRSGTLNTVGIVGMAAALRVSMELMPRELPRLVTLRDRLFKKLASAIGGLTLNGPRLELSEGESPFLVRLPGNLNCGFFPIEGQSLMLAIPELAVSSGSACTSAEPSPSHVLRAIGLSEEQARSSLRFGLGRFNTESEIDQAADWVIAAVDVLAKLI